MLKTSKIHMYTASQTVYISYKGVICICVQVRHAPASLLKSTLPCAMLPAPLPTTLHPKNKGIHIVLANVIVTNCHSFSNNIPGIPGISLPAQSPTLKTKKWMATKTIGFAHIGVVDEEDAEEVEGE